MVSLNQSMFVCFIRIIYRNYRLCLIIGCIFIIIQGYWGYYIYYAIDDNLNGITQDNVVIHSHSGSYIRDENSKANNLNKKISEKLTYYFFNNKKEILLHNGEEIVTPCKIKSKEALSALQRAKTIYCKQKIINITCEIQKNSFYESRLESLCPSHGRVKGRFWGCFIDDREHRILNGHATRLESNSPSVCADICYQRGFIYSGVQYSKECFCGNKDLPLLQKVPETECDMVCSGNSSQYYKCGGYLRMNIFETGLAEIFPSLLKKPSANDGPPVQIAYILTVNGRSLGQVHRLFKALFHRDHYFFIHVDSRQDYLYKRLLPLEFSYANVMVSRHRLSCIWGGTSLLSVLLHSMNELLKKANWNWDYVINLSESDFPIKTNDALVRFLTANKGRNFLKSHGHNTNKFLQKQGLDRTFLECEMRMWRIGNRGLPLGVRFDGGSDWLCLNRQFVEYIIKSDDQLILGLSKFFSYTLLPAESYFHTMVRNSQFCRSFTDNNLHITNWKRKRGCRCQYKHIVDWCGCSPNDFTLEDLHKIQESVSKNLFFARKFEPVISLGAINKLDEWLYGRYSPEMPNLNSYWENHFHFQDNSPIADDVDFTLYQSTMRITKEVLSDSKNIRLNLPFEIVRYEACDILPSLLLQSFSYHLNDRVEGVLVEFSALSNFNKSSFVMQTWIQSKNFFTTTKSASQRLKKLEVNCNFDLKEEVFRNFAKNLGPNSSVTVVTWWNGSIKAKEGLSNEKAQVIYPKIVIKDPEGSVATIIEVTVDDSEQVIDSALTLAEPLQPGIWTVHVFLDKIRIGSDKFAIIPLQFYNEKQISVDDFGSEENSRLRNNLGASNELKNSSLFKMLIDKTLGDGKKLLQWIDQIIKSMYNLKGICYVPSDGVPACVKEIAHKCVDTLWSSHSADPKLYLGEVDAKTGRLVDHFRSFNKS